MLTALVPIHWKSLNTPYYLEIRYTIYPVPREPLLRFIVAGMSLRSLDPNSIEHLWHLLKRAVRRPAPEPLTFHKLERTVTSEWNNISQEYINLKLSLL